MASRSELGISPVLLQAIAQTLSSHTVQRGSSNANTCVSNSPAHVSQLGMEAMSHHSATSGLVSHLLQNLNEPVASLMAQTGGRTPNLMHSSDKSCVLTQAGLSMLGLSDNDIGSPLSDNALTSTASKNSQSRSMVISSEDLNNFLVKEEQSDDSEHTGNHTINTVSSMLSALASQHIQESLTRKGRPGTQHQADLDTSVNVVTTTNGDSRSQPQIIIYSYINNTNQDVPSPQGNDIVLNDGDADSQTTYRVLLQPDDGADTKHMFSSELTFSSSSNVLPVTDAQNTQDGMSQPCPVCGDKVSG